MAVGSNPLLLALIVLAVFLVLLAPPIWWFRHGRNPSERRKRIWWAIICGLIVLSGTRPTAKGDWTSAAINIVRIEMGVWIITWGLKGSPVS